MKKLLFYLTFSLSLLLQRANAQTLTAANSNPLAGESFTFYMGAYASPGSSGTAVHWDFSTTTYSVWPVYKYSYTTSTAAAPFYSTTPSNIVRNNSSFGSGDEYYHASNNGMDLHGIANPVTNLPYSYYTNVQTLIKYPLAISNTYTDTWQWNFSTTFNSYYKGTQTITADGTGTLTTSFSTYTNVIRIKIVETYSLYSSSLSFPVEITNVETYKWMTPGVHTELFTLISSTVTAAPTVPVIFKQKSIVYSDPSNLVGIEKNADIFNELNIFPNPANYQIGLSILNGGLNESSIEMMDITGKMVEAEIVENQNGYIHLNTSKLNSGTYFIKVNTNGLIRAKRVHIIH